jgi:hypothetical protein
MMAFEQNIIFKKRYFSRWRKFTTEKRAEIKPSNDTYHLKVFICDYTKCQNRFQLDNPKELKD